MEKLEKNMNYKVGIFKNKKDIKVSCTEDNIIVITGMIGSGKTTLSNKYRNNKDYVVISLDCLYKGQDKENMNEDIIKINEIIKEKYPNQDNVKYFKNYYYEILNYINNFNKTITFVLEGQQIYRYLDIEDIKGTLFIKRTSLFNCYTRSIIRHIKRKKQMLKNNQITKKQFYSDAWYWIKRRAKQLRYYKSFNEFLYKIFNSNLPYKIEDK